MFVAAYPEPLAPCTRMDLNHLNLRVVDAAACRDVYQRHFGFRPAFEADGGYFVRHADGFLLALVPAADHRALPDGSTSDSGFPLRLRSSGCTASWPPRTCASPRS